MKVHILYTFQDGPWGGGNQFLRALKEYLSAKDLYVEDANAADVILFNSNKASIASGMNQLCSLAIKSKAKLINRIDGPISLRNRGTDIFDKVILKLNAMIFDGCVYQSEWCYSNMKNYGQISSDAPVVIHNAANSDIFYPDTKERDGEVHKVKLIATSWSANYEAKGFDIYEFLDKNLDFSKYEMTFVGRSPLEFDNIAVHPPVLSEELGALLRDHDIFITASVNDPCSNSLIEGLASGLPSVVRNSGGHPELVGQGGLVFNDKDDVLNAIDSVANHLDAYAKEVPLLNLNDIGNKYCDYFANVLQHSSNKTVLQKIILVVRCLGIELQLKIYAAIERLRRLI